MSGRTDQSSRSPEHSGANDPLSDALRSVRLCGGLFLESRFTAPWCVISHIGLDECAPFLSDLSQVIGYHVVLEGRMLVMVDGEPPVELRAGEIVLVARNDTHLLASAPGLSAVHAVDLIQPSSDGGLSRIRHGGGGDPTRIVCGFLGTQANFNPLLSALPRLLKLDITRAAARDWIAASVRFAAEELLRGRLASSEVMSRLAEVLLVEAVREYASSLGEREQGSLRGLADPHIGRALTLMHGDLSAPWSAERLAHEVALSRSAFMERFTTLVGLPPIRYLTMWRLDTARRHLAETRMSVPQIAHTVGYDSEEGFRRAFRREFGMSPTEWRNRRAAA